MTGVRSSEEFDLCRHGAGAHTTKQGSRNLSQSASRDNNIAEQESQMSSFELFRKAMGGVSI